MKKRNEFEAFTDLVNRVIAVPHGVIQKRIAEAREQANRNPRKRGPKKRKRPISTASSRVAIARKRRVA